MRLIRLLEVASDMFTALVVLTLVSLGEFARPDRVTIRQFSLFNPKEVKLRVKPGAEAFLQAGSLDGSARSLESGSVTQFQSRLVPGDTVSIRLKGNLAEATIADSFGRQFKSVKSAGIRVTPSARGALEVGVPGKVTRVLRGELFVSALPPDLDGGSPAALRIVLATDFESCVASVVAAEMSGNLKREAVKALCVVCRSFMLAHTRRHASEGFDFCDTTHCQFYRGEVDFADGATAALVSGSVAETAGEILSYRGEVVEGYYTAVCGGLSPTPAMVWGGTAVSGYPYRRTTCRWCRRSLHYGWQRSALAALIFEAVAKSAGFNPSEAAELLTEKEPGIDLVRSVIVIDRDKRSVMTADEFRRAVGRRLGWNTVLSPTFTIKRSGRLMIFQGRGFGSQVGLCMAGAAAQAGAGRGYYEILGFYYPEAGVARTEQRSH